MKQKFMSNKWARKSNHDISRPCAIFIAVLSLLMTIMFANVFFTNSPIDKSEATEKTAVFDYYEIQYRRRRSLNYLTLFFKDEERQDIRGCCVRRALIEEVEKLKKGTVLHMLINPDNNYIVELKANEKEMLNFDYAQKMLRQEGVGFLYLGIFMLIVCCYFVYKAITTKERLTKADIKFYWDIMRGK